ncbi:MAG: DnaJ domain-containing protein [Acidobacteriia bacterium]|nr:DnaJ domain-containing protein [Terriglobia bacterium]
MAEQSQPDYYFDLGVKPTATQQEIDRVYARRVAELRASSVEDAPEELAEVEAAYAVLKDPAQRARYNASVREEEEAEDTKEAAGHRRIRTRRTGSWIDAIFDILKFFK